MRLTYRAQDQNGKPTENVWYETYTVKAGNNIFPRDDKEKLVLKKLAAYEDAEEQGLLVRLPCKVGDTVFYITGSVIYKAKVIALRINESGIRVYCERKFMGLIGFEGIYGKTVFLTREEAEAALKGETEDV